MLSTVAVAGAMPEFWTTSTTTGAAEFSAPLPLSSSPRAVLIRSPRPSTTECSGLTKGILLLPPLLLLLLLLPPPPLLLLPPVVMLLLPLAVGRAPSGARKDTGSDGPSDCRPCKIDRMKKKPERREQAGLLHVLLQGGGGWVGGLRGHGHLPPVDVLLLCCIGLLASTQRPGRPFAGPWPGAPRTKGHTCAFTALPWALLLLLLPVLLLSAAGLACPPPNTQPGNCC